MRSHFPKDNEGSLRTRAEFWRQDRYERGQWRDFAEIAEEEREAEKKEEN
jgi:hypothetical protein